MAGITIAFETTSVEPERTAMEIEQELAKHHARTIVKDYDGRGRPCALSFEMEALGGLIPFKLPINVDAVYQILIAKKSHYYVDQDVKARVYAQAERTAWRIVKDWVHAQLALIQTQMVTVVEVFMPYMLMGDRTAYEVLRDGGMPALMEPKGD